MPALKQLKRKAPAKKDGRQDAKGQDEEAVDKRLLAVDQIHPFDIHAFRVVDRGPRQDGAPPAKPLLDYTARQLTQHQSLPHGIAEEEGDEDAQLEGGEQSEAEV